MLIAYRLLAPGSEWQPTGFAQLPSEIGTIVFVLRSHISSRTIGKLVSPFRPRTMDAELTPSSEAPVHLHDREALDVTETLCPTG